MLHPTAKPARPEPEIDKQAEEDKRSRIARDAEVAKSDTEPSAIIPTARGTVRLRGGGGRSMYQTQRERIESQ